MPRLLDLPLAPHSGDEVLAGSNALAAAFRLAGEPVILVRVERPNVEEQPAGSGFAEGLVQPGDTLLVKRSIGAFATSDLEEQLAERGVDRLVFGGVMTNLGVESTVRVAVDLGYDVEVVEDAMSALSVEEHEFAVRTTFPRFGRVTAVADYL